MELLTCALTLSTPAIVAYSGIHLLIVTEAHACTYTLDKVLVYMQTCSPVETFSPLLSHVLHIHSLW